MRPDRWRQVEELCHSALNVPIGERSGFVEKACNGDEELRREVDSLLSYASAAEEFINEPALEVAAKAITHDENTLIEPELIGKAVSHYRVLERLGGGGMGVVYKAEDTKLGRKVALKFLPEELSQDHDAVQRFQREAHAASALNHPHICTIHDIDEHEGRQFIVMELLEGQTLKHLISGRSLESRRVIELGAQIADALHSAHLHGVIHRDIKPANIFVTERGEAKVLDFGVAKLISPGSKIVPEDVTRTRMAIGTLPYMSPQQLRGEPADTRSDIWALGGVLYEMATGHRPFEAALPTELAADIIHKPPQPPKELNAALPSELQRIILKCLEKEPADRYQSAKELLDDLRQVGSAAAVITSRRASPRALAGASVVLTTLVVMGGLALIRKTGGRISSGSGPQITSVAVLPLTNLTGDPNQEYFADAMTEALITDLAKIRALKVISRTSVMRYKNAKAPLPQIARELGVDGIVEGSVQRVGRRIGIKAQLIRASTDASLWAESYDRESQDVLQLQSEVAQAIAHEIQVAVTPEEQKRLVSVYHVDPDAYEAYLKGSSALHRRSLKDLDIALQYFRKAAEKDPNYAAAWAGIAQVYGHREVIGVLPPSANQEGKIAARKALELDDRSSEAHAVWGLVHSVYSSEWEAAEKEFRRAIELSPNDPDPHQYYSGFLEGQGRLVEAEAEVKKAVELDPLSSMVHGAHGMRLLANHRYDNAITEWRKGLELNPSAPLMHRNLAIAYHLKGMDSQAWGEAKAQAVEIEHDKETATALDAGNGQGGFREAVRRVAEIRAGRSRHTYVPPSQIAELYALAEDRDKSLEWLQKSLEQKELTALFLRSPLWDFTRSDPRFQEIFHRRMKPQ